MGTCGRPLTPQEDFGLEQPLGVNCRHYTWEISFQPMITREDPACNWPARMYTSRQTCQVKRHFLPLAPWKNWLWNQGFPEGVLNIVTGSGRRLAKLFWKIPK